MKINLASRAFATPILNTEHGLVVAEPLSGSETLDLDLEAFRHWADPPGLRKFLDNWSKNNAPFAKTL